MNPFRKIFAKWFGRKASAAVYDDRVEDAAYRFTATAGENTYGYWPPSTAARNSYREWVDDLNRDQTLYQIGMLGREIDRLRRNKKRHLHLVAERDALIKETGR